MEEDFNFKRYIYVSTEIQAEIENIMQERSIVQRARFINAYDIGVFFRTELRNLKGVTYLILDLASFASSDERDIIQAIKLIRQKYDCRVIIIARGYKQGDLLLGKLFNLGIYNIITAQNDIEFIEQFKKTITDEGMTFGNAMRFQVEDPTIALGKNKTIVKENYIKVKQLVTVGVASCEKHQGATTLAINLVKYLNEYDNITACYIENNNHDTIEALRNLSKTVFYENKKMMNYDGVDLYLKPENIAEIQKYDYSFYVYDFGNFDDMSEEMRNNFISRDLKLIVSGARVWEEEKIADCLFTIGNDVTSYLFINFLKNEERENFKSKLGEEWAKRTLFLDLILDPFEVKNRDLYRNILKPYLINQNIKEEKKKNIFNIFKKKEK